MAIQWMYIFTLLLSGLFLAVMVAFHLRKPGVNHMKNFIDVRGLKGKTFDEIVVMGGFPSLQATLAGGKTLWKWNAAGCHTILCFDACGICQGEADPREKILQE